MHCDSLNEVQECRVYENDVWHSMIDYTLFLKHQKAYVAAAAESRGKCVLDFGCGSGYGAKIVSKECDSFLGVDASPVAISFAKKHYSAPNVVFQQIEPDYTLPFEDESFDVVTSFQVIEHIPDVTKYLRLLKRVLRRGGVLFITTPNRAFRLLPFQRIWQAAHEREYRANELDADLKRVFDSVELCGVYGTKEFDRIYIDHYRQTPFKAYVRQPIRDLAQAVLPKGLYTRWRDSLGLSYKPPSTALSSVQTNRFSLNDVSIGPDLNKALDFFARCVK